MERSLLLHSGLWKASWRQHEAYLQWELSYPWPFPSLCVKGNLLGNRLYGVTVLGEAWFRTLYLPIFGATFGMGNFPAERRSLTVWQVWQEVAIIHIRDAFQWHLVDMECFVYAVDFAPESMGSSGKNWGHWNLAVLGVNFSSSIYFLQALDILFYVPNPHISCRVLGGFSKAMGAWLIAHGRSLMDGNNYHYYFWCNLCTWVLALYPRVAVLCCPW